MYAVRFTGPRPVPSPQDFYGNPVRFSLADAIAIARASSLGDGAEVVCLATGAVVRAFRLAPNGSTIERAT